MATLNDKEFLALLDKHRDEFYRYVLRNVWNADTAEDVLSNAVMTAYEHLDKFRKGTNFRAWMYRILTNKCYVANRETKRSAIDIESIDESRFATDQETLQQAYRDPEAFLKACGDELFEAMRQLSTNERSCLLLLTMERYSYTEIASIMEMPVGTVMTHLARGRDKLRRLLVDYARRHGITKAKTYARKYAAEEDSDAEQRRIS